MNLPPFGDSENDTSQEMLINIRHYNVILMRNNNGACMDETGRLVRYGLGNVSKNQEFTSSDYVGIRRVLITQEMVGTVIGQFAAVEMKKRDWNPLKKLDAHEEKQNMFLQWVKNNGGFAEFIHDPTVDNLKKIFRQ